MELIPFTGTLTAILPPLFRASLQINIPLDLRLAADQLSDPLCLIAHTARQKGNTSLFYC